MTEFSILHIDPGFVVCIKPPGVLSTDDDLAWAMENMERHDMRDLPVLNKQGKFLGFVSYNTIFRKYRRLVKESESF